MIPPSISSFEPLKILFSIRRSFATERSADFLTVPPNSFSRLQRDSFSLPFFDSEVFFPILKEFKPLFREVYDPIAESRSILSGILRPTRDEIGSEIFLMYADWHGEKTIN